MGNNLILIGMPGAGKSTVGVLLAKTLGMDFLDTDLQICSRTGQTLQTFLDRNGMDAFLQLEAELVCGLHPARTVVATGGSVPMRRKTMEHLKTQGEILYLQVPLEELERRLSNIRTRGIVFAPGESLASLYEHRCPVYEHWADLTIESGPGSDIEDMVGKIAAALRAPDEPQGGGCRC